MSSLLTPCECGHGMGSHFTLVGHCCATAGAGPRRVTGSCRCKRYSPTISNPDNNMSELHNCGVCGAPVRVGGDETEGTHYYVNPDGSEHVCARKDHIADAGKMVDEMPEWVLKWVNFARGFPINRIELRAVEWLADDRERLLAALDRAQRERDDLISEREETEALLCPEDVGIREYVEGLVERLGDAETDAEFFRQVVGMSRREFVAFRDRVGVAAGHDVTTPQLCRDVLMAIRQESYDASFDETTAFRRPECAHEFCGNPDECQTGCIHPARASHTPPEGKVHG